MSHKIDRDFTRWPSVIIRPAEVVHFSSSSRLGISEGRRALRASRSFGSDGGFRRAFGRPRRVRRGRGPRGVRRRAHGGACARDVTPVVVSSSFESPQVPLLVHPESIADGLFVSPPSRATAGDVRWKRASISGHVLVHVSFPVGRRSRHLVLRGERRGRARGVRRVRFPRPDNSRARAGHPRARRLARGMRLLRGDRARLLPRRPLLAAASAPPDLALTLRDARAGDPVVRTRLSSEAASIAFNPSDAHAAPRHPRPRRGPQPTPGRHAPRRPPLPRRTPAVRARELRVDAVGVAPAAIVAAAWSPERTVYLGTDAGALLVVHPDTGDVVPPPPRVAESVAADLARAGSAFEGARAPDGAVAGGAVVPDGRARARVRAYQEPRRDRGRAGRRGALPRARAHETPRGGDGDSRAAGENAGRVRREGGRDDERRFFSDVWSAVAATRRRGVYLVTGLLTKTDPSPNASARGWRRSERRRRRRRRGSRGVRGFSDGSGSRRRATRAGEYHEGAATARRRSSTGVATCGVDGTIRGWNVHHPTSTPSWIRRVASTHAAMAASADPRGSAVAAVASTLGVLRVFDARGGASRGAVPGLSPPRETVRHRAGRARDEPRRDARRFRRRGGSMLVRRRRW